MEPKRASEQGMVVHAFDLSIQKAEADRSHEFKVSLYIVRPGSKKQKASKERKNIQFSKLMFHLQSNVQRTAKSNRFQKPRTQKVCKMFI